jgi:uncharacterized membrane protein (DUF106 family)
MVAEETIPMLLGLPPLWFILLLSVILSIVVTLVYKFATDQNEMKELKKQVKEYQQKMKDTKDNPTKMLEIQKEMSAVNMKYFKHSMKPMLITIVPFIIIFHLLGKVFTGVTVIPLPFHFPLSSLETGLGWIGTYIIFSMLFTTAFRKALKVA